MPDGTQGDTQRTTKEVLSLGKIALIINLFMSKKKNKNNLLNH